MAAIVFAGEAWFGSTGNAVFRALAQLGWDTRMVDIQHYLPSWQSPQLRMTRRLLRGTCVQEFNTAIIAAAKRGDTRALVTVKGQYIFEATLCRLREYGVLCINYYPDVDFNHPGVTLRQLRGYDHVFTTKTFHVPYLRKLLGADRASHLPHGFCPDTHRPPRVVPAASAFDVLYVGNHNAYKEHWLSELMLRMPQLRLGIYGHRWRGSKVEQAWQREPILGHDYARAIAAAPVCLAIHGGPSGEHGWSDDVSTRSFEIPACRGVMLHRQNAEICSAFVEDSEFASFTTADELTAQLQRLLADTHHRECIRQQGYARAVREHSYAQRAAHISGWIAARSPANVGPSLSGLYTKA